MKIVVENIHSLPSFRDVSYTIRMPVRYVHPIWFAGKHQQVTVARYAKV
ncbi:MULTISPECIES: hypothetical protein [Bacteroidaceae]|nr:MULTISPECIES: hypothetical protein [Bacteroidaceae]EYA72268.1 hypothetical protein M132_1028 [Bacteroides fragilis str. S24L15]EYA76927.1 hypothetical protein M133_1087 [Bacteroides fragilis str. S24L26]MCM0359514.1 hypothetical protein [Bacteroides fragilis]MCZ2502334.1 hypothetical protein [Bacteroides fragilis]MDC2191689.1 hypothetical protein [Bacteroides thetaiotaomicron]